MREIELDWAGNGGNWWIRVNWAKLLKNQWNTREYIKIYEIQAELGE